MEINKTINGNVVTLEINGRLDTNTSPNLEASIAEVGEGMDLVLNLANLEYVSSAGLRVLLLIQKRVGSTLNSFVLENVCEDVKEVLDMTGFSSILNIR